MWVQNSYIKKVLCQQLCLPCHLRITRILTPGVFAGFLVVSVSVPAMAAKVQTPHQEPIENSTAHVTATTSAVALPDGDEVLITLSIKSGYHINANPPSPAYLIPTVVTVPIESKITYPTGSVFKSEFLEETMSVYEGTIVIRVNLPKGSLVDATNEPWLIEVQSCSPSICYPPGTLAVPIKK